MPDVNPDDVAMCDRVVAELLERHDPELLWVLRDSVDNAIAAHPWPAPTVDTDGVPCCPGCGDPIVSVTVIDTDTRHIRAVVERDADGAWLRVGGGDYEFTTIAYRADCGATISVPNDWEESWC